jgi:feruloyl esterase
MTISWFKIEKKTIMGAVLAVTATVGCTAQGNVALRSDLLHGGVMNTHADVGPSLESTCNSAALEEIIKAVPGVTFGKIADGPKIPGGVKYVASNGKTPAYCEVLGSFITNEKTEKTANYLAIFPELWNNKFLQIGCSGICGAFAVNDPTSQSIVITNQGVPGESLMKGYASFSTDEGHTTMLPQSWAVKGPGLVDQDAIDDLLYRADQKLARIGKALTVAFYSHEKGVTQEIVRSYFIGCSEGGRDALVAANLFPGEYDGIIAGSPYANMASSAFQFIGGTLAELRSPDSDLPPEVLNRIDPFVKAKCDAQDSVKDGLIQNPAACDFVPTRDLPVCHEGGATKDCFTRAQIESISVLLSAVTDEKGRIVQPGFSVSELQAATRFPVPLQDPNTDELSAGNPQAAGAPWGLADAVLKLYVHKNDPNFHSRKLVSFTSGGAGAITNFHAVVPADEVANAEASISMGVAAQPAKLKSLIESKEKLLIWANLSDQILTPYVTINYYKRLAKMYGGYQKLQRNVRLFLIPGTGHCSMYGCGPQNFDPLSAIEAWVEQGKAPDTLIATQYEVKSRMGFSFLDFSAPPVRTMPLCEFPEMARYNGAGDVKDAANWTCPADDASMVKVGESGRQAGVLE